MATFTIMLTDTVTNNITSQDADFVINGIDVTTPGDQVGTVGIPI